MIQQPRDPEAPRRARDPAIEDETRAAERTERDEDWHTSERVVHELVPVQDRDRVGAGLGTDDDRKHALVVAPGGVGDGFRRGLLEGGNAISRRSSGNDLARRNRGRGEHEAVPPQLVAPRDRRSQPEHDPDEKCRGVP